MGLIFLRNKQKFSFTLFLFDVNVFLIKAVIIQSVNGTTYKEVYFIRQKKKKKQGLKPGKNVHFQSW